MVGLTGFEPATSSTPLRRATKLRYSPFALRLNGVKMIIWQLASSIFQLMAQHMRKIRVALVGASGYTGQELLRLLLLHPGLELSVVTSRQYAGQRVCEVFPRFAQVASDHLRFIDASVEELIESGVEAAFLALPHGVAAGFARPLVDAGLRVIDLSADFRLHDCALYQEFYGAEHPDPKLLIEAIYGLPERYSAELKSARLVASPGCYPTSILLPLLPVLEAGLLDVGTIVAHSMSGVSGAGKKADTSLLFSECNESVRAYGLPKHRHLSEIEQELSAAAKKQVLISFFPHLVPVTRGICTTISATLAAGVGDDQVGEVLRKAYRDAPFVRLLGQQCADTKNVTRTNFVDIGWFVDSRTGRLILSSAEDNLVKGAGGQAVQSFNVMFGFDQKSGLHHV